jgi:subtilisin family serine protease
MALAKSCIDCLRGFFSPQSDQTNFQGKGRWMDPLGLVNLTPLLDRTRGSSDVVIGLIDGPVSMAHRELAGESVREIPRQGDGTCNDAGSSACAHGTFVAGILSAKRGTFAPAICPNCTLLVRPIFSETTPADGELPSATPVELAQAILDCIEAGARVLNISAALSHSSVRSEQSLEDALDQAALRGVIVVVAAGNQGSVGSTVLTAHPWVIPVVGYDLSGRPMSESNLGNSIGRRGLGAPGEGITSLGAAGESLALRGTSAATPFVTGAVALLWSSFPRASAAQIRFAMTRANARRATVVPPLLNAWAAFRYLETGS